MATVVQSMIEPDRDAMTMHLETLFGACREEYPDGLIELRHGPPDNLRGHAYFFVTERGVEMAVRHAIERNRQGENVYVGVNPRKPGTCRHADEEDVEIAFFHFADIDKAEAVAGLVERYGALPPTMTVRTGSVPCVRPHLYWKLEEPVRNLREWTERQRGIAQALGGDMVIDPPRIMRLAGSVNFPTQRKLANGYRVELTSLRTEFSNERSEVTPEQVRTTYPPAPGHSPPNAHQVSAQIGNLQVGQTTLSAMSGLSKTRQLITSALAGDHWHDNVRDLTARLARLGRTTDEILLMAPGLTLPGYTVDNTIREMRKALQTARTKYDIPEPADSEVLEDGPDLFPSLSLDELEALPPPTYLIDGLLPEHGLSIVYGDPGAGKSFVVLDAALRIAHGMDWHGSTAKQTGVLYIAGEGKHGLGKRVKGWRREHAMDGVEAPFKLVPVAIKMLDAVSIEKLKRTIAAISAEVSFAIGLVIIDTVSRSIAGEDENKQEAMSAFVDGVAAVQEFTQGAVIGVHHAGKDKDRGMRGSSVLLGACDTSIKVSKNEQIVTLTVEKQKDDEESAPIYMEMKKVDLVSGLAKEQSTLVPFRTSQGEPLIADKTLSRRDADRTFDEIDRAWSLENPWFFSAPSKSKGRYLPHWMVEQFEISVAVAENHVRLWLQREYLMEDTYSRKTRAQALRVLRRLEHDQ